MGDVVIYGPNGKSLRFSHTDFFKYGKPNTWDALEIVFSKKWSTEYTGDRQLCIEHTAKIEEEERKFGGHNAYFGDIAGNTQLFASTRNRQNAENSMILPNEVELKIVHEYGESIIEGEIVPERKQLKSGERKDTGTQSFFDRSRRK